VAADIIKNATNTIVGVFGIYIDLAANQLSGF
jgi:hypothetical protein